MTRASARLGASPLVDALDDEEALASVLATMKPGQKVKVDIVHGDGSKATVTVTLGQFPS